MCGKFTAMVSWAQIVAFSTAFLETGGVGKKQDRGAKDGEGGETGEIATYRVNGLLPVIVWDADAGARKPVLMRWGFPDPRDWRRPRPIHGRSETIDAKEPFKTPFHAGQRGIVVFRTFNEGEEVTSPSGKTATRQWTIDPRVRRPSPRGFAFCVAARFELPGSSRAAAGLRDGDGARERAHPAHDQAG